jgi:hypothetical protein
MEYVVAMIKLPDSDEDRGVLKIPVCDPESCKHETTICTTCHDWWAQDHKLLRKETGK